MINRSLQIDPVIGDWYPVIQLPIIGDQPQKSWSEHPYTSL